MLKIENRQFNLIVISISVFFLFSMALLVGFRPAHVGSDTVSYSSYYQAISGNFFQPMGFEPGFEIFARMIAFTNVSVEVFLGCIFLLLFLLYRVAYSLLSGNKRVVTFSESLVFFAYVFSSSWFLNSSINGVRQGLSLALCYIGFGFFIKRKYFFGLAMILFSLSFHYPTILLVAFSFLLFFSIRTTFYVYIFLALSYPLGLTASVIERMSSQLPVNIYAEIMEYSGESAMWVGYSHILFFYTLGFTFIWLSLSRFYPTLKSRVYPCLQVYMVASLPYFVFGFGAYSNRFAVMAWALLPILNAIGTFPFVKGTFKYPVHFALSAFTISAFIFVYSITGFGSSY